MRVSALLLAAGQSRRFGKLKQFIPVAGKPLFYWSLAILTQIAEIRQIILVLPPRTNLSYWKKKLRKNFADYSVVLTTGGKWRGESVKEGLFYVDRHNQWVLIHDAARPLITVKSVRRCLAVARKKGTAVLATPAVDTVKFSRKDNTVLLTLPRERIWQTQTPQVFRRELLEKLIIQQKDWDFTDEAQLLERDGFPVTLVPGERDNQKLTYPEDLSWFSQKLRLRLSREL